MSRLSSSLFAVVLLAGCPGKTSTPAPAEPTVPADDVAPSKDLPEVAASDLCTPLQQVIDDVPSNFSKVQGEPNDPVEPRIHASKVTMPGADCFVIAGEMMAGAMMAGLFACHYPSDQGYDELVAAVDACLTVEAVSSEVSTSWHHDLATVTVAKNNGAGSVGLQVDEPEPEYEE